MSAHSKTSLCKRSRRLGSAVWFGLGNAHRAGLRRIGRDKGLPCAVGRASLTGWCSRVSPWRPRLDV